MGRLLYAAVVPTLHEAPRPMRHFMTETARYGLVAVFIAYLGFAFPLVTKKDAPPRQSEISNNSGCIGNCQGATVGAAKQSDKVENTYDPEAGCTLDPEDKSVAGGWGPARNVLAKDQYSEFPAFNLDKLPEVGDERGFYDGREDGIPPPYVWHYDIHVQRDKTYILRMIIHNSAYQGSPENTAKGTRLEVNLPVCTGRRIASQATIISTNSAPKEVWGGVTFIGDEPFNLVYVSGSAILCTNHFACKADGRGGVPLSEDFLTIKGVLLGFDSMNGDVPGGYQASLLVLYKVRPQFAPKP
ncbi:hypothetical protein [Mycobacterium sp. SA01]|uniref:hypothetical protein n=1 Tax=Mycobacterium sp. SA01 TaxID=3238820 RepID=UPI00351BD2BB